LSGTFARKYGWPLRRIVAAASSPTQMVGADALPARAVAQLVEVGDE